jgi:hypothetical protein
MSAEIKGESLSVTQRRAKALREEGRAEERKSGKEPHTEVLRWTCLGKEKICSGMDAEKPAEKGSAEDTKCGGAVEEQRDKERYPCRVVGGAVSEDLFDRGLCLPSGTAMTEDDLERVVGVIRSMAKGG